MSPSTAAMAVTWVTLLVLSTGCDSPPPSPPAAAEASASVAPLAPAPPGPPAGGPAAAPSAEAPSREIAGAAHILVAYKGAAGAAKTVTRSKEDAKKRAEEALQKIRDQKANFETLVAAYSDDPLSLPTGGAIGNFERNVMPPAFSDATFALPVGGISEVIETPRGFHIIRRVR